MWPTLCVLSALVRTIVTTFSWIRGCVTRRIQREGGILKAYWMCSGLVCEVEKLDEWIDPRADTEVLAL